MTDDKLQLIHVCYVDHVLYNRTQAQAMQPQIREAIGWLIYECDNYITLCWDRDAGPPNLHGGDPKASGLVLLKGDILDLQRLKVNSQPLQKSPKWLLNSANNKSKDEYALRPSERKTQPIPKNMKERKLD